ncbi:MAG: acylhydrolase [Blautia sp.]|nr:acylhydrolase [Blautia sp.]
MEKRRILCFGDSLTWGFHPVTCERMGEDERWPCVLQNLLGDGFRIIEEGQNGRTIATDDFTEGQKNGLKYVIPCLESQKPLDLMIIMLGANDMKRKFGYSAADIAGEMELFLQKVLSFRRFNMDDRMEIMLISPPIVGERGKRSPFEESFDFENTVLLSSLLTKKYEDIARKYGCSFLDSSRIVKVSEADRLHLLPEDQQKLGRAVYEALKSLFSD